MDYWQQLIQEKKDREAFEELVISTLKKHYTFVDRFTNKLTARISAYQAHLCRWLANELDFNYANQFQQDVRNILLKHNLIRLNSSRGMNYWFIGILGKEEDKELYLRVRGIFNKNRRKKRQSNGKGMPDFNNLSEYKLR